MSFAAFELRPGPWTRFWHRRQPGVSADERGLEVRRSGAEVERVAWERVTHLEVVDHRRLFLIWGALPSEMLELSCGRLCAGDYFDRMVELRRQARDPQRICSTLDNGELQNSRAWTLGDVCADQDPVSGWTLTQEDPAAARLRIGEEDYLWTPLNLADPALGMQIRDSRGRVLLTFLPGRVFNAEGLHCGGFERFKFPGGPLRGGLLRLPDGQSMLYHGLFRCFYGEGRIGEIQAVDGGRALHLAAPLSPPVLLLLAGFMMMLETEKTSAPPLALDRDEEVAVLREPGYWRVKLVAGAPLVMALAVALVVPLVLGKNVFWLMLAAGLGGGLAGLVGMYYVQSWMVAWFRRVRRQGEMQRVRRLCRTLRGGLHLWPDFMQFCPGMVFPHTVALSYLDLGHVERPRGRAGLRVGLGSKWVWYLRLLLQLTPQGYEQLSAQMERRVPGHRHSRREGGVLSLSGPLDWAALLPGLGVVHGLRWEAPPEGRRGWMSCVVAGRRYRLATLGPGRLELSDAAGELKWMSFQPKEVVLHNGMVLAVQQHRDAEGLRLGLCTGVTVAMSVADGGILIDGELAGQILRAGREIQFVRPMPEALALLLLGVVRRARLGWSELTVPSQQGPT